MADNYKRLSEEAESYNTPTPVVTPQTNTINNAPPTAPYQAPPPYPTQPQPQVITVAGPSAPQATGLKNHTLMKVLSIAQLVCAVLIAVLGSICVGIWGCYVGTGIWAGLFSIVAASFGVAAVFKARSRCLLITYLVLIIIATVCSGLVITFSSMWAYMIVIYRSYSDYSPVISLYLALQIVMLILALVYCKFNS